MKITHPVTRASFGVAALVAIALLANWLILLTPLASRGIDFTEKKIHTLSDGTKTILGELDAPVVIRYYATRGTDFMPEAMKLHMRRVDDLLKEYVSLADGNLRVEYLDPQPDTEEEDSANLDGINGQRFDNENLYFGLAISCLDKTEVIPFLNPNEETMLEYQLSSRIAEVSTAIKPKIGLMSGINIRGSTGNPMMGTRATAPWIIHQQMSRAFDLVDIPLMAPKIDPDEIKVLFVFHPAGISPAAEYAIDQYLLKGGTVIACLDAYSIAAQMQGGGNPMMGTGGASTSTLPKLLNAWGVEFESGLVLADPTLQSTFDDGRTGTAVLSLSNDNMPQKDSIVTRFLENVVLYLPGGFSKTSKCKVHYESLIQSTDTAGYVDSAKAARLETVAEDVKAGGKRVDLAVRLYGKFKTAFPAGNPIPPAADETKEKSPDKSLKQSAADGNVFLIADIDAFWNQFAYIIQNIAGTPFAEAANNNSSLLLNLLDHAVGSKHLIGSRSRAAARRPFTTIQEMEKNFDKVEGAKRDELDDKIMKLQQKFNDLNTQRDRGNALNLEREKEKQRKKYAEEIAEFQKQKRELEKDLQKRKDDLAGRITLLNVGVMPAFVILFGLGLYLQRRSSTGAR